MTEETFIHRFRNGVTATMTVKISDGLPVSIRCLWSEDYKSRRVRRVFTEYQRWRATVFETIAQKYGRLMKVLVIDV